MRLVSILLLLTLVKLFWTVTLARPGCVVVENTCGTSYTNTTPGCFIFANCATTSSPLVVTLGNDAVLEVIGGSMPLNVTVGTGSTVVLSGVRVQLGSGVQAQCLTMVGGLRSSIYFNGITVECSTSSSSTISVSGFSTVSMERSVVVGGMGGTDVTRYGLLTVLNGVTLLNVTSSVFRMVVASPTAFAGQDSRVGCVYVDALNSANAYLTNVSGSWVGNSLGPNVDGLFGQLVVNSSSGALIESRSCSFTGIQSTNKNCDTRVLGPS